MKTFTASVVVLLFAMPAVVPATESDLDIQYTRHVLNNGLIVMVSEDHKAPIAAVNVWYHVGSKNEKGIREMKLGEIRFIDADGNPVE